MPGRPLRLAAAILAGFLAWGLRPAAEAPEPPREPAPAAGSALDWDRDFDLILESRRGKEGEAVRRDPRAEALQKEIETLRAAEADLAHRLRVLSEDGVGEAALQEMLRLDVPSPDRARAILEARLQETRSRISDLEDDLRRRWRAR